MRYLQEPAMRPPQEVRSLIIQVSQGCTWNRCNFCYVSRGYPFRALTAEQLEAEAIAHKPFFNSSTRVYLAGSNPFALPAPRLEEYVRVLRKHYPDLQRVSLQSRIDDIARKSDAELSRLCQLGLSHLYIGTENGNEQALKLMNKGHTARDTVEQLKRLDNAGITYTNFYVLGLGGKGQGQTSGSATAQMFNQVHPQRITTTGITLFEDAPIAAMARNGEFSPPSEREMIEELRTFLSELEIDTVYDGIHYLNPLNYRFRNKDAEEKRKVLEDIDEILATCSDEELELMVNRREKISL